MPAHVGSDIDLRRLAKRGQSSSWAFEEFCCQIARHEQVPTGARFERFRGDGGDGGVECIWVLEGGEEWGWQAKYVFDLRRALPQLRESIDRAISAHRRLTRYVVCLPFELSPDRGPRAGTSETARFERFRREQEELARERQVALEIERWGPSELAGRLLTIDPEGGRRRYWFEDSTFGHAWFQQHMREVTTLAGPRYTPELHHGHALDEVLDALGRLPAWGERVQQWRTRVRKAADEWKRDLGATTGGRPEFPNAVRKKGEQLSGHLDVLLEELEGLEDTEASTGPFEAVDRALECARACAETLASELDSRFGEGSADSRDFREWSAHYRASFPAAHLDHARTTAELLRELRSWLVGAAQAAAKGGVLVVSGPAGVGKTHGVCDAASKRVDARLPTIVLFGHRIHGGAPLWTQARDQLGLPATWSRDAVFDALDAASDAAGSPALLFVDALNESKPPTLWQDELPLLVEAIRRRPGLRLCVTCRSGYLDRVLRGQPELPRFDHPGFAGREFDACRSFFAYYELDPPVGPLLHPELANPLFLKLVCEALKASGLTRLPSGWIGIRQAVGALLAARDRELAQEHPSADQHTVSLALFEFARQLSRQGRRDLPLTRASDVVASFLPSSYRGKIDLLGRLLSDELLLRVPAIGSPDGLEPAEDRVTIAFERLRDHLLADTMLEGLESGAPISDETRARFEEASRDPDLAEALAVLVPERLDRELPDLVTDSDEGVMRSWIEALPWRDPQHFTARTETLVREALSSAETVEPVLDAVVALAVRPGHRLDASWLHQELSNMPMSARDALWCPYLYRAFTRGVAAPSPVARLTDAAWSDGIAQIEDEVLRGWLTALCWFFAAADRRVRDSATKAAVRLTENRPAAWLPLLEAFLDVDDDYIVERCLASAYGAFLRNPDRPALSRVARLLAERLLADRLRARSNALIRDHVRCIGELAHVLGALPPELPVETFRPPYESEWPLAVPSQADLMRYEDDESRARFPRLYDSCVAGDFAGGFVGDFAIYTVPAAMSGYEHSLPIEDARRWIFQHILDLGYTPERFADYDYEMLHDHGGGRGRPMWADRIGKKYQLIGLSRLLARVKDHVARRGPELDRQAELQGELLRDIDPSLLTQNPMASSATSWWMPVLYRFEATADMHDEQWVAGDDFPDSKEILRPRDDPREPARRWRILDAHVSWRQQVGGDDDWKMPRRDIWTMIKGYLVPRRQFQRCWRSLTKKDFFGRWMREGWNYQGPGYVGEYPWGPPFKWMREAQTGSGTLPLEPVANVITSHFDADAWQREPVSICVPSVDLVRWTQSRWNGGSSFVDPDGRELFCDPSFIESGPACLLADDALLRALVAERDLVLVWTILTERRVLGSADDGFPGMKHVSRVHWLDGERLRSSRNPVGEHVQPNGNRRKIG